MTCDIRFFSYHLSIDDGLVELGDLVDVDVDGVGTVVLEHA